MMSDIGGNSPVRTVQAVHSSATLSPVPALTPPEPGLQREASAPLPHDNGIKSVHAEEALSLPTVNATIVSGRPAVTPAFSGHSLFVTGSKVSLTSHTTQEEITLPIAAIFDVFPVQQTEDSNSLFLSAGSQNLLQILSTSWSRRVQNSQQQENTELTVTLALPSMLDCTRLALRLAEMRRGPESSMESSPMSMAASSPLNRPSPVHLAQPPSPHSPMQVPEERKGNTLNDSDNISNGLLTDYASLCYQVVPNGKVSPQTNFDRNAYKPCDVRILTAGLVIEQTMGAQQGQLHGPWSVPWASLMEVRVGDTALDADQPPISHPQVVRLCFAYRAGLVGSTSCILNVAVDSPARTQALLRAVKAYQQQHFPARPMRPPGSVLPGGGPGAALTASENRDGGTGGTEINAGPPPNRVGVQVSSLNAPPGGPKESEPLNVVHINNVPVQLTPAMTNLLMSYQPEDSTQPNNFEIDNVHILLPTVPIFQRCAIVVDKLGLSVTPLVTLENLQERGRSGAKPVRDANGNITDYSLVTEALHFPISALVDVAEESELKLSNMPTLPAEMSGPAPGQAQSASSSGAATSGAAPGPAPATASSGSSGGRRQLLPFARLLAPWGKPVEKSAEEKEKNGGVPIPPYPHLVGVRVKGALAGRLHGAEKTPIHLRLNAQPPPPVAIVFCFAAKDASLGFIATVLALKKYHLSVALSTYLNTLTAVSQRQSERRGSRQAEEGVVAQRMMGQAATPSVEPPPLPPRPADLPQANRLPRMVTNDEGEVFWYIPRKQSQKPTGASASGAGACAASAASATSGGGRAMPVPQPDSDTGNPPAPDPSPRDDQACLPVAVASGVKGGADSVQGFLDVGGVGVRIQTPPRSSPAQSSSGAAAPGASQSLASSSGAGAMTPTKSLVVDASAFFDADLGVVDTPAPCLASPTPTPGRKQ